MVLMNDTLLSVPVGVTCWVADRYPDKNLNKTEHRDISPYPTAWKEFIYHFQSISELFLNKSEDRSFV